MVEYVQVSGTPCTDNDNDGVCEGVDCDDNDPTLPTTPGTACDDGDPNTTNDVIQADGCTCLGCTDNDGDGFCLADDCDDNDPTLPTTPGTTCDDGDPNTTNDVIQADGCTCQGTNSNGIPLNCGLSYTATPTSVTIMGLTDPHIILKLFTPSWATEYQCVDNCPNPLTISGLSNGTYHLSVDTYTESWQHLCNTLEDIPIGSGSPVAGQESGWLFFNAAKDGRTVNLNWVSNTGYKNDHFVVEHSVDGILYTELTLIPALAVEEEEAHVYRHEDPITGLQHYRIRQGHLDGSHRYSNEQAILFDLDVTGFVLFPNPTEEELYIALRAYRGQPADITLYNSLGQPMLERSVAALSATPLKFDLSGFKNGWYTAVVRIEGKKPMVRSFVVAGL